MFVIGAMHSWPHVQCVVACPMYMVPAEPEPTGLRIHGSIKLSSILRTADYDETIRMILYGFTYPVEASLAVTVYF